MSKTNSGRKKELAAAALVFAGLSAYTVWTDLHVYVSHYELRTNKVSDHIRIVQVSDFHNDKLLGKKMLKKIRQESPDVIVITGDFIDRNRTDISYALDAAESLAEIAPVYYVPGNHESAVSNYNDLKDGLLQRGVIMAGATPVMAGAAPVMAGATPVEIDPDKIRPAVTGSDTASPEIHIFGIDDPYFVSDDNSISGAIIRDFISEVTPDSDRFSILLSHRPEAFEDYVSSGFDLVFTGHAHGGQFRFPFIGGIFSPGQGLLPKYDVGEFTSGCTTMIVSRGIGNSIMPLRIGNPPELVVLDIQPQ